MKLLKPSQFPTSYFVARWLYIDIISLYVGCKKYKQSQFQFARIVSIIDVWAIPNEEAKRQKCLPPHSRQLRDNENLTAAQTQRSGETRSPVDGESFILRRGGVYIEAYSISQYSGSSGTSQLVSRPTL